MQDNSLSLLYRIPPEFQTMQMLNFRLEQPDPALSAFSQLVEFGCERYDKVRFGSLSLHHNDGVEICYIRQGSFNWEVEGQLYRVLAGDVFVTMPWQQHGGKDGYMDPGSLYWIVIRPKVFTREQLQMGSWSGLNAAENDLVRTTLLGMNSPVIRRAGWAGILFDRLASELLVPDLGSAALVNGFLREMLVGVVRAKAAEQNPECDHRTDFARLDEAVRADLGRKWTLSDLAAIAGKQRTSLIAYLQQESGFTPMRYLLELRIKMAQELLIAQNNLSVRDIAYTCGFSSPQHFSRAFRARTGYSPLLWRSRSA